MVLIAGADGSFKERIDYSAYGQPILERTADFTVDVRAAFARAGRPCHPVLCGCELFAQTCASLFTQFNAAVL